MYVELSKTFFFQAAHRLTKVPEGHKCARPHGHGFKVDIVVAGEVDPEAGWLMDFGDIRAVAKPIIDKLDHQVLNDIEGLDNPTSEHLAHWIWERLVLALPILKAIVVYESDTSSCRYYGPDYHG